MQEIFRCSALSSLPHSCYCDLHVCLLAFLFVSSPAPLTGAFASNAPTGAGLYDGLDWLVDTLAKSHTQKSVTEPVVQTMSDAKGLSGRLLGPASQWLKQVSSMSWWSKGGSQSTVTPAA